MYFAIACVLLVASTSVMGFTTGAARGRSVTMMAEKSKALPFLNRPAKLDGKLVGDFGFDPLGFTDNLPSLDYVVASELKHGRVAMLATVGFIFQQYVHILSPEANPLAAISALGYGPNLQILSFIGVIELATWKQTYAPTAAAGDLGFDPLNQLKGKSPAQVNVLKLKEIKNGRLAMIAIIGLLAQNLVTGGAPSL